MIIALIFSLFSQTTLAVENENDGRYLEGEAVPPTAGADCSTCLVEQPISEASIDVMFVIEAGDALEDYEIVEGSAFRLEFPVSLSKATGLYMVTDLLDEVDRSNGKPVVLVLTEPPGSGGTDDGTWYNFSFTDEDGKTVEGYISGLGSKLEHPSEDIYTIAISEGDAVWKQYKLSGESWSETPTVYASNPLEGIITAGIPEHENINGQDITIQALPSIENIKNEINKKIEDIEKVLYNKVGFELQELTAKDKKMIRNGIACGVDDNLFWGGTKKAEALKIASEDEIFKLSKQIKNDTMRIIDKAIELSDEEKLTEEDYEKITQAVVYLVEYFSENYADLKLSKEVSQVSEYIHTRGKIEGIREGKIEGIREGKIEGKKEEKIAIAKNLLDILDIETIAAKTGLSIEQVKLISKNEL